MTLKRDKVFRALFVSIFRRSQSYGNLLSWIQKLKKAIFWSACLLPEHGNQNSVEQKWFGMTCPNNVCLT